MAPASDRREASRGGSYANLRQVLSVAQALEPLGLNLPAVCAEAGLDEGFFGAGLDTAVSVEEEAAVHRVFARHVLEWDALLDRARDWPTGAYDLAEVALLAASSWTEVEEVLAGVWREPGSPVFSRRGASTFTLTVHDDHPTTARWLLKLGTWLRLFHGLGVRVLTLGLPFTAFHARSLAHLAPRVSGQAPVLEIVVDSKVEPKGNPFVFRSAVEWLQDRAPVALEERIRADVRVALQAGDDVAVARSAERLGLSVRTLQRRLSELGVPYRRLVMEVRGAWGAALLEDSSLPIGTIASRLGFAASSSFDRSFRAWSGQTPSQWRMRSRRARLPRQRDDRDDALGTLDGVLAEPSVEALAAWIAVHSESDPAVAALGQGWMACRAGSMLEAQRLFTDALRQLASQRRSIGVAYACNALGELYLDAGETWSAESYLELAIGFGSGLSPESVRAARQLGCWVRVRANRVSEGLRALRDVSPPDAPAPALAFRIRSALILAEGGQFETALGLVDAESESDLGRGHRDLLRVGRLLVRGGRPRLLRRVLRFLDPLESMLQPSAIAVYRFLDAAGAVDPEERMARLLEVPFGQVDPFLRVEALEEAVATAQELGEEEQTWQLRVDAARVLAENVRTSLRAGEVRSFHAADFARSSEPMVRIP